MVLLPFPVKLTHESRRVNRRHRDNTGDKKEEGDGEQHRSHIRTIHRCTDVWMGGMAISGLFRLAVQNDSERGENNNRLLKVRCMN